MQHTLFRRASLTVALLAVLAVLAARAPGPARAQPAAPPVSNPYAEQLNALLAAERASVLAGEAGDPDFSEQFVAIWRAWQRERIAPGLRAAAGDCRTATAEDGIVPEALAWAKFTEILFGGGDESDPTGAGLQQEIGGVYAELARALMRCYDEAFEQCLAANDPFQAEKMLAAARQLQLFGQAEDSLDLSMVERCLTFELEFDSLLTKYAPVAGVMQDHLHVRARVPLRREAEMQASGLDLTFVGEGPLEWVKFEHTDSCFRGAGTQSSSLTVSVLQLKWKRHPGADPDRPPSRADAVPAPFLMFSPGLPQDTLAGSAASGGSCTSPQITRPQWALIFEDFHGDEAVTHGPLFNCAGWATDLGRSGMYLVGGTWERGEGATLVQRRYSRTREYWETCRRDEPALRRELTETTTISIRHAPRR